MINIRKTAIVTGASQGIGAGLVEAFLKRGYNAVANSRHITRANPFTVSANVVLVDGDIGDRTTAAKIVSKFGRRRLASDLKIPMLLLEAGGSDETELHGQGPRRRIKHQC